MSHESAYIARHLINTPRYIYTHTHDIYIYIYTHTHTHTQKMFFTILVRIFHKKLKIFKRNSLEKLFDITTNKELFYKCFSRK